MQASKTDSGSAILPASTSASTHDGDETVKSQVIWIVKEFVDATNTRNFDPDRHPWTMLSPEFTAEQIFAHWPMKLDRYEFLQNYRILTNELPDYHANPADISAVVNKKTGRATVFLNLENTGFTPGVVRYSVGRVDFEGLGGGVWRAFRYCSMPGSPAISGNGRGFGPLGF